MHALRDQVDISYGRVASGSLCLFRDPAALERAVVNAGSRESEGLRFPRLTKREAVDLEPVLAPIGDLLAGAIHYEADQIGDAYQFCGALTAVAQRRGVDFRFRTEVTSLEVRSGRVTAVMSASDRFKAERYIVAAGSYSTPLLCGAGISLPVRPAKGYSITYQVESSRPPLRIPLIDDQLHAAVVPLDGAIQIAGTAEFTGFNLKLSADRINNLRSMLMQVLPGRPFDAASGQPWCGLRPMSVDGAPIIGATKISNLPVSSGHGHVGWTMAAGSAELMSD